MLCRKQPPPQTKPHNAANKPSTPTNPAAATGTCVGTAKPLLEELPPPAAGVDAGAEEDDDPPAEVALAVTPEVMVLPLTILAGTVVGKVVPLLAVAITAISVTLPAVSFPAAPGVMVARAYWLGGLGVSHCVFR